MSLSDKFNAAQGGTKTPTVPKSCDEFGTYERVPIRWVKVGDRILRDDGEWIVEKIKEDANGYGLWCSCPPIEKQGWVFENEVMCLTQNQFMDNNDRKIRARNCIQFVDMDGIVHKSGHIDIVTQAEWDAWLVMGKPDMCGSVYSRSIIGPGAYYIAGSDYQLQYDVYKPIAKLLRNGEIPISPALRIPELDELERVNFVVYGPEGAPSDVERYTVFPFIKRGELLMRLRSHTISVPDCPRGCQLCLQYLYEDKKYSVSVINRTSDIDEEHYENPLHGRLVAAAVLEDNPLYTDDYRDACLRASAEGKAYPSEAGYIASIRGSRVLD